MLERALTSLRLRALDLRERFSPRHDPLVPPRHLKVPGRADFAETGEELVGHLIELGGLEPHERVLDVGCGFGPLARPLARYLDSGRGSYDGLDVDGRAVGWCRRRYGRAHPNFHFRVADVYDRAHHPRGGHAATEYRLPYDDDGFDMVIAGSAFTTLLPDEADHYLAESARVLRDGGRLFATFFLLDAVSRAKIAEGEAGLPFLDAGEQVALLSEDLPEEAVAYDAGWVAERLAAHGLEPTELRPGTWSGRDDGLSFEDIVVARHA